MKKLLFLTVAVGFITTGFSQKGKNKTEVSEATKKEARRIILGEETTKSESKEKAPKEQGNTKSNNPVWEGTSGLGKASKNQPAKVRKAFASDYPSASNVSWSKYRGDWTATFANNGITSTAVYHANGQRKDTRTVVSRPQLPRTIEDIIRKKPVQLSDIIRIDVPQQLSNLFRVKTIEAGSTKFTVYDANGAVVNYDY